MNRSKENIFRYCAMGFTAVLIAACVMLVTGTAFARYRTEYAEGISFTAQAAPELHLGQIDPQSGDFVCTDLTSWELTDGGLRLDFAVANGQSETELDGIAQSFRVRLIGGAAIQTAETPLTIILAESPDTSGGAINFVSRVSPIDETSLLHKTFGDGWVYTFSDEQDEELSWTLEGGTFSRKQLSLVILLDENTKIDPSLLQLQIIGGPAA